MQLLILFFTSCVISAREYIMSFLDLHDESRRVQDLSSGQQRRVSLAVALIHSPELVILEYEKCI